MNPARIILFISFLMVGAVGCSQAAEVPVEPQTVAASTPLGQTLEPEAAPAGATGPTAMPESLATPLPPLPSSTPTPTPPPILRQLTSGGCCVGPYWAPDGAGLLFLDRPSPDASVGLWRVDLQGTGPAFYTDRLGVYSPDMALLAFPSNGATFVERLATGEQWQIPNGGREVRFSTDGVWVVWTAGQTGPPFDTALREVWVSRADGSEARQVFSAIRGGYAGWFPDGRMLVSGLAAEGENEQVYWALDLNRSLDDPANLVELGRGGRLREAKISPDGNRLAYLVTASAAPEQNGLWVADSLTGARQRLDLFGGFQWRDAERLLVVPLDLSQPAHRLIQWHVSTGAASPLTDPEVTAFRISNGDWVVSPDGRHIGFVSAADGNIWVLSLPAEG